MIAHIRGTLTIKDPEYAVIDAGGVGYRLFISTTTYEGLPNLGETVTLLAVTMVREDAFHLYGFLRDEERRMFLLLLTVTGIGTKLALASLSAFPPEELAGAIAGEDITALSRISGVGRRLAQRLAMELKEKVGGLGLVSAAVPKVVETAAPKPLSMREELISALVNLGYKRPQVERVVRQVIAEGANTVEEGLRAGLKLLSSQAG